MRRLRFAALSLMLTAAVAATVALVAARQAQPVLGTRAVPVILVEGGSFRDLNRNGALDPYEDWRLPVPRRVVDLIARMTLDEKARTLMHGTAPSPPTEVPSSRSAGSQISGSTTRRCLTC
ncbi:MAG: hypothetical protein JJE40_04110 [Vicinamibacteria bacterium]|nr:hypothetical protein [Vicinamibacteria bacterium]